MTARTRDQVGALLLALLVVALLAGCRGPVEAAGDDVPAATLERVEGTNIYQVTLTARAVDRLGIKTGTVGVAPVRAAGSSRGASSTVPYAAVVYDADGSTWAYTMVRSATYLRRAITIDSIVGQVAYLTSGPPLGTAVVVVGAPELLGTEYQIAGEQ